MKNIFPVFLLGASCAASAVAYACSCAPPPEPKIALEKSAAVFVGRFTSSEKVPTGNKYQFAVSKKWKGVAGQTVSIVSGESSAACGINFDSNRDYLVYAFKNEGDDQLRTNLCTRTKRVEGAEAELVELGAPMSDAQLPQTIIYTMDTKDVVQLKAGEKYDPLMILNRALQDSKDVSLFRVTWQTPRSESFSGTALYNRKNSTLKTYSRSENASQINISSVLYSGVTDDVLQKLSTTGKIEEFSRTYTRYGVTKKDVGSKTVSVSS